jgi:haloalkane dehalogenase
MSQTSAPELPSWLSRLLPFERYMIDAGGRRMHVMEQGRGETTVLMIHGNPTWGFLWRKVAARLEGKGLRLVIPDLLGLGFSEKISARDHTLETHAAAIGALVDALDLKKVVLAIQDWGGPVGLAALEAREARLAGLVVLNTVVTPPRPGFRPTAFHRLARLPVVSDVIFRGFGFPQNALWFAQGDRTSIRGEVARAYRFPLRGVRNNVAPLAMARMVPDSLEHPSIPALQRCQALIERWRGPSAIVWGDKDPVLGRVRGWIEKLMPAAKVTRTQAGHFLQEEVPDEIAAAIVDVAARAR